MKWPKKTRCFAFTDFSLHDYKDLDMRQVRYLAWGLEICPKTKRQHHQGWVMFHNPRSTSPKSLRKIGTIIGDTKVAHIEPCMGSLQQNMAYCSKEGKLQELGDRPKQGDGGDLKTVVDRIAKGEQTVDDMCMGDPMFYHQYGRTISKAEDIALRRRRRTWMTEGIWLFGVSGSGKSHAAFQNLDDPEWDRHNYVKCLQDDWWDGYTGQETVILNEFRGQITFSQMCDLVDKWPAYVKRRNREKLPFLARRVIVTSVLTPQQVYHKHLEDKADTFVQFQRRFKLIEVIKGQSLILPPVQTQSTEIAPMATNHIESATHCDSSESESGQEPTLEQKSCAVSDSQFPVLEQKWSEGNTITSDPICNDSPDFIRNFCN